MRSQKCNSFHAHFLFLLSLFSGRRFATLGQLNREEAPPEDGPPGQDPQTFFAGGQRRYDPLYSCPLLIIFISLYGVGIISVVDDGHRNEIQRLIYHIIHDHALI